MTATPVRCRGARRAFTRSLLLLAPFLAAPPAGVDAQQARPAEHVVLVSVDGLRPEFYLDERWPAPMMQRMAREGPHAKKVRGITPTVTYPSHTTLVTGALPARHGIPHNRPFEPGDPTGTWYMESDSIRVPALWDAVRASGGTSAGISWPVSAGAAIDFNIPEFWSVSGREGDLTGPAAHTAALRPGSGGAHGYFPDVAPVHTGFVAWGAGVAPGRVVVLMGLVDVAPVVAALLDLDFEAPDGVLRPGILAAPEPR